MTRQRRQGTSRPPTKKQTATTAANTDEQEEDLRQQAAPSSSASSSWRFSCNLALFGDSTGALLASFLLLLAAVAVALLLDDQQHHQRQGPGAMLMDPLFKMAYQQLGPIPKVDPPRIFEFDWDHHQNSNENENENYIMVTEEMRQSFEKDGVIAVRGLLDADLLHRLDDASQALISKQQAKNNDIQSNKKPKVLTGRKKTKSGSQFYTVQQGAVFLDLDTSENATSSSTSTTTPPITPTTTPPFLQVALLSTIPKMAASLLNLASNNNKNDTLRLMRDIFLAKDEDEYICGWHVDDTGFWPATADAPGVNAWIALDDMPIARGGGFALAVGSHTADWKDQAYQVTGSTHTFPIQGFVSGRDIVENRVGDGTCNIAKAAPHLHRRMEETKRIYNVQKGDVIFHTRWLFHRTVPFVVGAGVGDGARNNKPANAHGSASADDTTTNTDTTTTPLVYRRYSIRYGPGWSEIPKGFGTEPSVLWDKHNGGRTADQVSAEDAAWYPQAFPKVVDQELEQMKMIAKDRMATVLEQAEVRRKQMRPRRTRSNSGSGPRQQPH